jgi:pimeloyl-ACP methyl ester carboxylesterase
MSVTTEKSAGATALRPFTFKIPETELEALRTRIAATRWPDKEPVSDQSQGVQLATIQKLARYWASEYDWRKVEAKLNALPQFITEIDGLDIHFIHVRSKHENALPLIVTHGWPGSIIEQLKIVDPLTNPTAHGGSASDAFHLVIPSMPGYAFSGKPTTTGWGPDRIARAWVALMKRLGYTRFVAQGGDWGAVVTEVMATQGHPELIGIHTNMPGVIPPALNAVLWTGGAPPANLSGEEKRTAEQVASFYKQVGYALYMGWHPQTMVGLSDSPVALAALLIDHDPTSHRQIANLFVKGEPFGGLTRDDILDNVTLFWLTNTGISAGRLYWENKLAFFDVKNVPIPVAVSVFPNELYEAPLSWTQQAFPKLVHFNKLDQGGHFAAWEQPKLLSEELRAGFGRLRK